MTECKFCHKDRPKTHTIYFHPDKTPHNICIDCIRDRYEELGVIGENVNKK